MTSEVRNGDNLHFFVGQEWEDRKTGHRMRIRKIECEGDGLVFERVQKRGGAYSVGAWMALVEQGHFRLLPNIALTNTGDAVWEGTE